MSDLNKPKIKYMAVKLTLDIFSGRPNPEIFLDDKAAKDLFKRLSFGTLKKQNEKTNPFPSVLGYRGLIIEQPGKNINKDIPALLHYAHDTVYADGKAAQADSGLESFLFDNFKRLTGIKGLKNFRSIAETQIRDYLDKRNIYICRYIFISNDMT